MNEKYRITFSAYRWNDTLFKFSRTVASFEEELKCFELFLDILINLSKKNTSWLIYVKGNKFGVLNVRK